MTEFFEKIKNNFKKNRVILLLFLVVWVVVIGLTLNNYSTSLGKNSYGNGDDSQEIIEIDNNTTITQTLEVLDGTDSISFFMGTYARKNNGKLFIYVTDESENNIYADTYVNVSSIQDNAFLTIGLNQKIKKQFIRVTLSSDSENGTAVGLYHSTYNDFKDGKMYINGQLHEDLSARIRFLKDDEILSKLYKTIITSTIILFTLIILVLLLFEPKYEVLFSLIVLFFGLIFMFIMTPLSIPDERAHYERSMVVSNRLISHEDLFVEQTYVDYSGIWGHVNTSNSYMKLMNEFNSPAKNYNVASQLTTDFKYLDLTCYTPQSIGLTIGRLLKLNMLKTFYLGRFTNLLFYVVCIYLSIKKTPVHKLLFGILASMPMFIQQAASYSYDCFAFALTFVSISYFLKWYFVDERVTLGELLVVFIANGLLTPVKFVYSLFSFLYWLVPVERFGNKKIKVLSVALITIYPFYALFCEIYVYRVRIHILRLLGLSTSAIESNVIAYNPKRLNIISKLIGGINRLKETEPYTFTYVLNHPFETINLFLYTIRYSIKLWFYGAIGRTMSGLSLILPLPIVHALPILLLISSFRKEEYVEPVKVKLFFLLVCICSGMLTLFGMLVGWTTTSDNMIQGLQGRYFSPLLPYFFSIFNNGKLTLPNKLDKYLVYVEILLMFEVVVYILSYTFVN